MDDVRTPQGLVCVCAECGRVIRTVGDDDPTAVPLLSHGICPPCAERLYGALLRGVRSPSAGAGG